MREFTPSARMVVVWTGSTMLSRNGATVVGAVEVSYVVGDHVLEDDDFTSITHYPSPSARGDHPEAEELADYVFGRLVERLGHDAVEVFVRAPGDFGSVVARVDSPAFADHSKR